MVKNCTRLEYCRFKSFGGCLEGKFSVTFEELSGNFRGTFGELSGNFWGTFRELSGDFEELSEGFRSWSVVERKMATRG